MSHKIKSAFRLATITGLLCSSTFADVPLLGSGEGETAMPTTSIFSPEQRPGSGSLDLGVGDRHETIELGTKTGLYATGLVLKSSALPEIIRNEYPKMQIIQLALGTLSSRLDKQIPQFGAFTLVTSQVPKKPKTFLFSPPKAPVKSPDGIALGMISPPSSPKDRPDEEKLTFTFIAQSGTVRVIPQGTPEPVLIQGERESYTFMSQGMRLEIDCQMSTPFNPQKEILRGAIEVAVISPSGSKAEQFAARIASSATGSFGATTAPLPPQGITQHPRGVAGSTKDDAKPKMK